MLNYRQFLLLLVFLLAGCSPGSVEEVAAVQDPPNILWIVPEDTSPWIAAYGDSTVATPTLDAMADEGVTFLKAFAANPICSPIRSALMTGRYPTSTGVHNHRRSRDVKGRDAIYLPEGHLTLPEIFRAHGYETFNIGKDDYNFVYDRSDLYSAGEGEPGHIGELKGVPFNWTELAKGGPFFGQIQLRGGKVRGLDDIPVDSESIELPPYYPDSPSFRKQWADHYRTIINTDNEVAEILAQLEASGEADNTAVFFISDHGMMMLRHKQFVYDGGVHVPIIVTYPKGVDTIRHHGARREQLITTIDLSAASLELAGIPIPDYFEGRALFGESIEARDFVPLSRDRADFTFDQIRGVRTDRFKYIRNKYPDVPYMQSSYRDSWTATKDWFAMKESGELTEAQSLFVADTRPAEELYDLEVDPHEVNNLADDPEYADVLAGLSATLDAWIDEYGDKGQVEETETEIAAVVARWGEMCVDRRCVEYREKHGEEEASGAEGVIKDGV